MTDEPDGPDSNEAPDEAPDGTDADAPPARAIRAVVLDWAGTTQDFGSQAPVEALVAVFASRGVSVARTLARAGMGLHKRDHLRGLLHEQSVAQAWRAANGDAATEFDLASLYSAFLPLQADAIRRYGALIPGTVQTVAWLRNHGIAIGATTGYPRELLEVAAEAAANQGYVPDVTVCADEVPAARPEPWMLLRVMEQLRAFPPSAVIKVGDTVVDIDEGRNAGTWTVAVARSGSLVGLSEETLARLPAADEGRLVGAARATLSAAGADVVIDSIADLPDAIVAIEHRLAAGGAPGASGLPGAR